MLAATALVTPFKMYKKMDEVAVPNAIRTISQKLTKMSTAVPKVITGIVLRLLLVSIDVQRRTCRRENERAEKLRSCPERGCSFHGVGDPCLPDS